MSSPPSPAPIAVVGIDCRFPGAPTTGDFWRLLLDGRVAAGPVPAARWDTELPGMPDGAATPVALIDRPDRFDHGFFGIAPAEAEHMDPQQRLLLQSAWRAVEDAGIAPGSLAGTATSVHVGIMSSEWAQLSLTDYRAMTAQRGSGNGYCMTANRLSYHLDLKGPSMAVDTACSSSLVATQLACAGLRAGETDTALAAGVNLLLTPALSVFYRQAGLAAPDGRCRPFAAGADGIGRGEGVGVVVLRRLADAVADRQRIYAVIEGGAVGSDGRSNGLTAPSRFAQAEVIRTAHRRSGVEPGDLAFVEGHGTGTRLGDMIEVRALGDVHAGRDRPALLGSVKGNLGHLEGAAGIAGLIKTCLALERRTLPGTPGGTENPELRLAEHGLRHAATTTRLPAGTIRAGISSFGLGGTNVHLLLSSPPRRTDPAPPPPARDREALVLTVSAAAPEALPRNVAALRAALAAEPAAHTARFAWTTTVVKTGLRHRAALAGLGREGLLAACDAYLRQAADPAGADGNAADAGNAAAGDAVAGNAATAPAGRRNAGTARRRRATPRVALVFTGQGSQYPGMTAGLYRHCPPYRHHLDRASAALGELGGTGRTLVDLLTAAGPEPLTRTDLAQPALFAVEYALAATLLDLGVTPVALLGHSVGEFAAACAGGGLELAAAARLVAARGELMQALPPGGAMLAVPAGEERVRQVLGERLGAAEDEILDVAAVNGPEAVTLSGTGAAVRRAAARLRDAGHRGTELDVSHAFHSALMRPMAAAFADHAARVSPAALSAPLLSTVRDAVLEKVDGGYWTEQICAPVRFAPAAARLAELAPTHVVEVGPRPVLLRLLRGQLPPHTALACCPGRNAGGQELAETVAALHRDGVPLDFDRWYGESQRVRRPLPGYVFDPAPSFWHSPVTDPGPAAGPAADEATRPAAPAPDTAVPAPEPGPAAAVPAGPAPVRTGGTGPAPAGRAPAAPSAPAAGAAAEGSGRPASVAALVVAAMTAVTGHPAAVLRPDAELSDLGLDSVLAMRLLDELEPHLGPVDVAALLPSLTTLGELIAHLERKHPVAQGDAP